MAKLKVSGSASGTGTITLIAPATSTDRTITLPDESITLGGGVDGIVSTADATAITIDSSERVGFGETSPTTKLDILGSANQTQIRMSDASADGNKDTWITSRHNTSTEEDVALIHSRCGTTNSLWLGGTDAFNTQNSCTDIKFLTSSNNTTLNGTERLHITSDGRGLSQFTAKVWVNFNGTGTIAIRDSHNVSSLTDNSTGNYRVNFTNAMANTNYSAVTGSDRSSGTESTVSGVITYNTTNCTIDHLYDTGAVNDSLHVCLQVFGD